ncbi:MAG: tetratricopeptide repeat protein [Lachnospiraceae bacterium]|nr:tetratricopeptide repeat protein [Lachnospiraceae bacterium]
MNRRRLWIIGMLFGICLCLACGCGKKESAAYVERGMEALAAGDAAGAKAALSEAEKLAPEDPAVLRAMGVVFYEEGNDGEALDYFSRALLALGEGHGALREDILRYKADAEFRSGALPEAVSDYGQLILLDNENAEYYLLRGRALAELGDAEGAVADFRTVSSLVAGDAAHCEDMYLTLKERGAAEAGLEFLETIRQAGPQGDGARYGRACLELARVRMEEGRYEEALSLIQGALPQAEEPARQELLYAEGACYERLLDFGTALERFRAYRDAYGGDETLDHEIAFLETRVDLMENNDIEVQTPTETGASG